MAPRGRTCVGCRRVSLRADLVRLVRTADGEARVDPTAGAPGRGAWVCADRACFAKARGRLGRALRAERMDQAAIEAAFEALLDASAGSAP